MEPVKVPSAPIVADVRGADEEVSESDQKRATVSVVESPPLPPVEPQFEKITTDTAADQSSSAMNNHPPKTTASPLPKNTQKSPTSLGVATPPAHELRVGETKKSRVGIYVVVALVVVASVFGAYKMFSAKSSSTKFAEVRIVSTPKGAAVAIDSTDVGDSPHSATNLASGKHTFVFTKKGYQSRSVEISLAEGKNPDVHVTLEKSLRSKASAGEQPGATGGQPVSAVKPTRPEPTTPSMKQAAPSPAKVLEKPMEERIQDAITLYESKKYTAATKHFKAILEVVPNNSVAKFYMQKSAEAGKGEGAGQSSGAGSSLRDPVLKSDVKKLSGQSAKLKTEITILIKNTDMLLKNSQQMIKLVMNLHAADGSTPANSDYLILQQKLNRFTDDYKKSKQSALKELERSGASVADPDRAQVLQQEWNRLADYYKKLLEYSQNVAK